MSTDPTPQCAPSRIPWPKDPEELIPLADLPNYLEFRRGKPIRKSAGYRWRLVGILGERLQCRLRGGVWWVCKKWLDDFEDRTTKKAEDIQQIASPR